MPSPAYPPQQMPPQPFMQQQAYPPQQMPNAFATLPPGLPMPGALPQPYMGEAP